MAGMKDRIASSTTFILMMVLVQAQAQALATVNPLLPVTTAKQE